MTSMFRQILRGVRRVFEDFSDSSTATPDDRRAEQITGADLRSRALWFPWNALLRLRSQLSSQPLAAS
jgi:hypothetical protein